MGLEHVRLGRITYTREGHARGEGISIFKVDAATGWLDIVEIFGGLVNPSFLALSRNGERLYTVHGDCRDISAFRIAQSRVAINKSGANKVPIDAIMTGRDVQVLVR